MNRKKGVHGSQSLSRSWQQRVTLALQTGGGLGSLIVRTRQRFGLPPRTNRWRVFFIRCLKRRFRLLFGDSTLQIKGALQLLMNLYGQIHFAQVPERVSTKSFVVLITGTSKSNHIKVLCVPK